MINDDAYSVSCSHRIVMELQLFGMWVAVLGIVLLNTVDSDAHSLAQGNDSDMEVGGMHANVTLWLSSES